MIAARTSSPPALNWQDAWPAMLPTNPAPRHCRQRARRRSPSPAAPRLHCSSKISPVSRFDWQRVTVTLVDERQVPETSPRSNARLVREALLRNRAAPRPTLCRCIGNPQAADAAPFDVVVLGMGSDGHTASFFPGGDHLPEALDADTPKRIIEMNAPGAGEPRLTFTLPVLLAAGRLKLHIEGSETRRPCLTRRWPMA
jgi:6-phosphogluconolactonase/glucosamine-6-phosphate isomerase/deaminase